MEERTEETRSAPAASVGSQPASPEKAKSDDFDRKFTKWVYEIAGISPKLLASLDTDDDWTFVIKMHGILETALNHLILNRLQIMHPVPKLVDVISHLETNDRRTGKIAFIKVYDLLPGDACLFVRMLSEVRNRAVHDIKNFDLDLVKYLQGLNKEQKQNWKLALTSWMVTRPIKANSARYARFLPNSTEKCHIQLLHDDYDSVLSESA